MVGETHSGIVTARHGGGRASGNGLALTLSMRVSEEDAEGLVENGSPVVVTGVVVVDGDDDGGVGSML